MYLIVKDVPEDDVLKEQISTTVGKQSVNSIDGSRILFFFPWFNREDMVCAASNIKSLCLGLDITMDTEDYW